MREGPPSCILGENLLIGTPEMAPDPMGSAAAEYS